MIAVRIAILSVWRSRDEAELALLRLTSLAIAASLSRPRHCIFWNCLKAVLWLTLCAWTCRGCTVKIRQCILGLTRKVIPRMGARESAIPWTLFS